MRQEIGRFFRFAQLDYHFVLLLIVRCPFDFLYSMYYANLMQKSFDTIVAGDEKALIHLLIRFIIATILLFLYNGTVWILYTRFTARMHARIKRKLFRTILSLPYQSISEKSQGEWVTHMNSDTELAGELIGGAANLPHAVNSLFCIFCSTILLIKLNFLMFCLAMLFLVPAFLLCEQFIVRPVTQMKHNVQKELSEFTNLLRPLITEKAVIQIYDGEAMLRERILESSLKLRKDQMRIHRQIARINALQPLFHISGYLAMVLFGGGLIQKEQITIGGLMKQLQYRGSLVNGISMLNRCEINMRSNYVGIQRVNDLVRNGSVKERSEDK